MGVVNTFVNSDESDRSNNENSSRDSTSVDTESECSPAVGRLLWEQEVESSILSTPTTSSVPEATLVSDFSSYFGSH